MTTNTANNPSTTISSTTIKTLISTQELTPAHTTILSTTASTTMATSETTITETTTITTALSQGCTCKMFMNGGGWGNCQKSNDGHVMCYVKQPSSCSDVRDSGSNPGEQYSYDACLQGGTSICDVFVNSFVVKLYRYCNLNFITDFKMLRSCRLR